MTAEEMYRIAVSTLLARSTSAACRYSVRVCCGASCSSAGQLSMPERITGIKWCASPAAMLYLWARSSAIHTTANRSSWMAKLDPLT